VELLLKQLQQGDVPPEEMHAALLQVQQNALQIRDVLSQLRDITRAEVYQYAPGLEGIVLHDADSDTDTGMVRNPAELD